MKKITRNVDLVYYLYSTGREGFMADPEWLHEQKIAGLICASCGRILPEHVKDFEEIRLRDYLPTTPHAGAIGELNSATMLAVEIVEAVGYETLKKVGKILPVIERDGVKSKTHVCVVESHETPGLIRGPTAKYAALCKRCGKVLYWPSWPTSKWYLLRRYWDGESGCAFIGGDLLFSRMLYEKHIAKMRISKLRGAMIKLVDTPIDDLPTDYNELCEALKNRNALR